MVCMKNAVSRVLVFCFVICGGVVGATGVAATPDRQKLLETACRSSLPVLVVDSFPPTAASRTTIGTREASIDIDGDDQPDVFHGELVERLVQVSGHPTERLDLSEMSSLPDLHELLLKVITEIESGNLAYSRVNLSQESPLRLSAFKKDLFLDDPTFPEITSANIQANSRRILEKLWSDRPDFMVQELADISARFAKAGVPIVVAAGNFGPGFVNMFSLLPGVISVGSLEVTGQKLFTSSDNAFVTDWLPGVVVPTAINGGIDINDDAKPDFLSEALTNGRAVVSDWVGQTLAGALSKVNPEFLNWAVKAEATGYVVPNAALNIVDAGMYLTEDLVALPTVTQGTRNLFRSLGAYGLKIQGSAPRYFFDATPDGILMFDPKRDGSANQRTRIAGTSFAAPRICAAR